VKYHLLTVTALIVFLTSCSSIKSSSTREYIPSGSTIGVVTIFDDDALALTKGNGVLSDLRDEEIATWMLTQSFQGITEQKFQQDGFFRVKHIEYPLAELRSIATTHHGITETMINIEERLFMQIQDIINIEKLDAVMLIFIGPVKASESRQYGTGYGLEHYSLFREAHVYVHANYALYDVKLNRRFKGGTLLGVKSISDSLLVGLEEDRKEKLIKRGVLEAFELSLEEALKHLFAKLKRSEHINTMVH